MLGLFLGPTQRLLVVVIVLMLFGGARLPELLREVSRAVQEIKRNRPSDRTVRNVGIVLFALVAMFLLLLTVALFRREIFGY